MPWETERRRVSVYLTLEMGAQIQVAMATNFLRRRLIFIGP
jgi:hypothetical protein